MTFNEKLTKYAKLIVEVGINVQPGQIVVIDAPVDNYQLVRKITHEAYLKQAGEVVVHYHDEEITKMKYDNLSLDQFSKVPLWYQHYRNDYAKQGAAFISIIGDNPEGLKGVDPKKIALWSKSVASSCKPFYDGMDMGYNPWCIAAASSLKWANLVYPDMSDNEAVNALWQAIFKTCRLDEDDYIAAWKRHRQSFVERVNYLNDLNLASLHYTNSLGTDLTVTLNDDYLFAGGGSYDVHGNYYFPNMPTEEIFTSPNYLGTNGVVYSSLPLNYQGNLIEDFKIEFKDGRIINFTCKVGGEILKEIIEIDEGSHYLGEIALVPYDSPISNLKTVFYNTLFDENASCHLAIGKGFSECLKDGLTMSKSELQAKGINDSLTHVDFMIGTADLKIVGMTKDKQEVLIFEDGNFVF